MVRGSNRVLTLEPMTQILAALDLRVCCIADFQVGRLARGSKDWQVWKPNATADSEVCATCKNVKALGLGVDRWLLFMPVRALLVGVADAQDRFFAERFTQEL